MNAKFFRKCDFSPKKPNFFENGGIFGLGLLFGQIMRVCFFLGPFLKMT